MMMFHVLTGLIHIPGFLVLEGILVLEGTLLTERILRLHLEETLPEFWSSFELLISFLLEVNLQDIPPLGCHEVHVAEFAYKVQELIFV